MKNVPSHYKGFLLRTHETGGAYFVTFWRVGEHDHKYKTMAVTTGKEARRLARLTINSLAMLPPLTRSLTPDIDMVFNQISDELDVAIRLARFAEGGGSE